LSAIAHIAGPAVKLLLVAGVGYSHHKRYTAVTFTHHFEFSGQPRLAGCPLDSQVPLIVILSILASRDRLWIWIWMIIAKLLVDITAIRCACLRAWYSRVPLKDAWAHIEAHGREF